MASKRKWGCVIAAARGSLLHSRYYSEHFVLTTAYCMWSSSPCYRGNSGVPRSLHDNLRPRKRQSRDANPDGAPAGATLLTPAGQHGGTEGPAGAASTFSFHRSHWSTKASAILSRSLLSRRSLPPFTATQKRPGPLYKASLRFTALLWVPGKEGRHWFRNKWAFLFDSWKLRCCNRQTHLWS